MLKPMISEEEKSFIAEAAAFLNHPRLMQTLLTSLGKPFEAIHAKLPPGLKKSLNGTIEKALASALKMAVESLHDSPEEELSTAARQSHARMTSLLHTGATALTGAIGGLIGPWSLPFELPISTGIMLRGISSIALDWGHPVQDPKVQLECLYVFTLGSRVAVEGEDPAQSYLVSRLSFVELLAQAAYFMSKTSSRELIAALEKRTASTLMQYITRVATHMEMAVTEKLLIEMLPFVGAIGGASINAIFSDYFMAAARYHFGLLHLEEKYGEEEVRFYYREVSKAGAGSQP